MRYDSKNGRIEISVSELCPKKDTRIALDKKNSVDIANTIPPEMLAGSAPREAVLVERHEGIDFRISGKADAVFINTGGSKENRCGIRIIEFFAVSGDDTQKNILPDDEAACLAYMFCKLNGQEAAEIEAVTINVATGEITRNLIRKKLSSLKSIFVKRLAYKIGEARMLVKRCSLIMPGAANVKFPYPGLRDGQETMMRECYDAMRSGERLFIEAPTGIGKTMSALYPAVKFFGNGRCDKIFYLTPKTSTQAEAYKAAGMLFSEGAKLRTIVLSAKENCCLKRGTKPADKPCGPGECSCYAASDEKMTAAVCRLLALQNGYEHKIITKTAIEYGVCPYELSLNLSEYCEIIIADYNYAFDPLIRLKRYFENPDNTEKYIFLIDEAHNLADRARSMYSAEINTGDLSALHIKINHENSSLSAALGAALECLRGLRGLCRDDMAKDEEGVEHGFYTNRNRPEYLEERLLTLKNECELRIFGQKEEPLAGEISTLGKKIMRYLAAAQYFDERFLFYCEVAGSEVRAIIYCLDPSFILERCLERVAAAIMFSATLTPIDYFADILGGGKKARTLALASPFDISNLFIAAVDNISTRFEDRERTLNKTVSYIAAAVSGRCGNYMVYFPSYRYMEKGAAAFARKYYEVNVLVQKKGMTREDKERFLDEFRRDDGKMRVGFCVLGGSFSEGIDLPGGRLIGVVIVGVGMPGISSERNIMRDYYDLSRESGYDYAYTYPGMNNVMQAAGRVIRSDTDRGVVVLIDDRYATPKYVSMYPKHWSQMQHFSSAASLNSAICEFWKRYNK